jgi:hypothetical protein
MYNIGVSILLFCIITFLLVKLSMPPKEERETKLWRIWGIRTSYWEGIIIVSGLVTALFFYILKSLNIFNIIIF